MRPELADLIVCPECRGLDLTLAIYARDARKVRDGQLLCKSCGTPFAIQNGILDLLHKPSNTVLRERAGWVKLLGETNPALDAQMIQLPYLDDPRWWLSDYLGIHNVTDRRYQMRLQASFRRAR